MPGSRHFAQGLILATSIFLSVGLATEVQPRIDGTSEARFNRSLQNMLGSMSEEQQLQLMMALLKLRLEGVQSAAEVIADPQLQDLGFGALRQRLDGMSFDEVLEMAARVEGPEVRLGSEEPPGVPDDLLEPLAATVTDGEEFSLAGIWTLTSDINGHIRRYQVRISEDGTLDYVGDVRSPGRHAWERSGDRVRLRFNDGHAVYVGRFERADLIEGEAGNVDGRRWKWTARRDQDG